MMKSKDIRLLATASATLLFGVASTAFVYEKGLLQPVHLTKVHQAQTSQLEHTIREQQIKIEEMKKRKEEMHNVVLRYQETERLKHEEEAKKKRMYPALKFGLPGEDDVEFFYYDQYIARVDYHRRVPKWVINSMTSESFRRKGNEVTREKSVFANDENDGIAAEFRSNTEDYWHSGYDRGHMVPAGDMRTNQRAMDQTFYLNQNIVPQNNRNNRGYWRRFESYVRNLPREYKQIHVVTGPLYLPADYNKEIENDKNDLGETIPVKRKLSHDVIGDNQVHVPTHLFKVVLAERHPDSVQPGESNLVLSAFLLPNEHIPSNTELRTFEVPVEELEKRAGMHFFAKARRIPDSQELRRLSTICLTSRNKCRMAPEDPSLEYITDIQECKSEEEVQRVWQGMLDKGLKPHEWTKKAYHEKLERIARVAQLQLEE